MRPRRWEYWVHSQAVSPEYQQQSRRALMSRLAFPSRGAAILTQVVNPPIGTLHQATRLSPRFRVAMPRPLLPGGAPLPV